MARKSWLVTLALVGAGAVWSCGDSGISIPPVDSGNRDRGAPWDGPADGVSSGDGDGDGSQDGSGIGEQGVSDGGGPDGFDGQTSDGDQGPLDSGSGQDGGGDAAGPAGDATFGDGLAGCMPGTSRPCNTGHPGLCASGQQTCVADGTWGMCQGQSVPGEQSESCGSGADEDCDGAADLSDEDCQQCPPNQTETCATGLPGICSTGERDCVADVTAGIWHWEECAPDVQPGQQAETKGDVSCTNGQDDDCDGLADLQDGDCGECVPGDVDTCSTGFPGACGSGSKTCDSDWEWGVDLLRLSGHLALGNTA